MKVTYDEIMPVVVCVMKREKKCVDGIKNPFDDCP